MDYYSTRTPDNYSLIRGFFIVIMTTALIGLILFFTLEINLTTKGKEGLVVSKSAPIEYLTPYDAEVQEIFVEEGESVKKGDTLLILYNSKLSAELEADDHVIREINTNVNIYEKQLVNLENKIKRQKKDINIFKRKYENQKKGSINESSSLKKQLLVLEDKVKISEKRIDKARELLNKGAISEKEFDERYQKYLDESNRFSKMKNEINQQETYSLDLDDSHDERISKQKLNILNTETELLELKKIIEHEKIKRDQLTAKGNKTRTELDKLVLVSDIDGNVTNVFNTKRNVNLVTKNQPLLVVTPINEERFYINMKVPEEEIKDIRIGQNVHVKIKAYNYYQYGIIKGKISFIDKEIAERQDSRNPLGEKEFYILADIPDEEAEKINLKNGLKVDGEIILDRVRLYQYVIKSMFAKV